MCGLLAVAAVYVIAMRRGVISPEDDVSPWFRHPGWRPVLFAAGLLITFVALESPIDRGGDDYLFSLHMVQHMLLMMVAPPLLLLGIAGARPAPRARYSAVRTVWWAITRPWPAVVIFNAVLLLWHIPSLYDTTLTALPVHILEHLSFIAVGLVVWWPVVDPLRDELTVTVSPLTKIAALSLAGIPPTVLGIVFALASAPLYSFYVQAPRLWGVSPLTDQQYGGVIMLGVGNIVYFIAIIVVFMRLFSDPGRDEEVAADRIAEALR
jgi:putative membrane protein